jgi:hypothetical protein
MPGIVSRPGGLQDTNYNIDQNTFSDEEFRGEYTGTNLIYKGFARPGANTALPVWQIAFLTYDGANNVLTVQWPLRKTDPYNAASANLNAASNDYEFIWDSRASYTFV